MDNAKVVTFFENQSNGWQEVYYLTASSLGDAFTAGNALVNARAELMGFPTKIVGLRVEDATENRESQLTPYNLRGPTTYVSQSDNVAVAAMMRLYSTSSNRTRAIYLRGNPDNAYDLQLPNNADAQIWSQAFDSFGTFLSRAASPYPWQIKAKARPDQSPSGNAHPIITVAPVIAGSGRSQITCSEAHGLDVGDYCTLYQMQGVSRLSGVFKVIGVASDHEFVIPFHFPSGDIYNGAGYVVPFVEEFSRISSFATNPRWTRRITGRPFEVTRGRRRSIRR